MSQLRFAPWRIDAWTFQGDFLDQADRAELKRRVAHNLLAALPGLNLAAEAATAAPDRAILRQVQDEHRAWRQGWTIGPDSAPYGRRPWSESPGHRQPNRPWDGPALLHEQGRSRAFPMDGQDHGPDEPRSRTRDQASPQSRRTCWVFLSEPTACDRCLEMASTVYAEKPERPHPNCKCRIESRMMTAREAHAFLADQAAREKAIRAQRERLEQERKAAKLKANTPAHVDDSRWSKDGDPVTITGKDKKGRPVRQTFNGHALPDKTKGGVAIKTKDDRQIDRRVTKEMSDTLQTVLDDPRCKEAGIAEVTISSTTDGQHNGPENRHYQGKAVDISRINGTSIKDDATARKLAKVMQEVIEEKAKELNIKDNLGPAHMDLYTDPRYEYSEGAKNDHKNHVHIAII